MFWYDSVTTIVSVLPASRQVMTSTTHMLATLLLVSFVGVRARYKQPCTFPSIVKSSTVEECQWNAERNYWWCPLTEDFDLYQQWRYCGNTSSTYAGNDPGQECVFPFKYQNKLNRVCLKTTSNGGYWWCATSTNYDQDKKWTRCLPHSVNLPCKFQFNNREAKGVGSECRPFREKWVCLTEANEARECPQTEATYAGNDPGQPCHFPFYYLLTEYQNCIDKRRDGQVGKESFTWCSTTTDYDQDRRWTRCKSTQNSALSQTLLIIIVALCVLACLSVLACIIYYISDPTNVLRRYCLRRKRRMEEQEADDRLSPPRIRRGIRRRSSDDNSSPQRRWPLERPAEAVIPLTPTAPPPPYEKVMEGRPAFPVPTSPSPAITETTTVTDPVL